MSSINGFHPPSTAMVFNGQNETSKRLPSTSSTSSTSSNSITATNKRSKTITVPCTVNETRSMKGHKKRRHGQKKVEAKTKRLQNSDSNNNNNLNNHNNSLKKLKQSASPHSRQLLSHPILHHHHPNHPHHHHHHHRRQHPKRSTSNSNPLENIPSSSSLSSSSKTNKSDDHVVNNDHCDSCGEFYGEMISCDTCPATFHLICANPPLSREDVPKGSYFCENCRAKAEEGDRQPKLTVQPVKAPSLDPKTPLPINGVKKNPPRQAALEQLKLPTGKIRSPRLRNAVRRPYFTRGILPASNGRCLVQPSGEIKFRATNNNNNNNTIKSKPSSLSSAQVKRKRTESSCSPPSTSSSNSVHAVRVPLTQIETLRRLLLSCRPEEFRGPSLPFDDPNYSRDQQQQQKNCFTWQKYCFVCRRSSTNHGPSMHCDYCPLTYHLDCLTPPMTSLPSSADKWMCPNHIEPMLDRFLLKKNKFSTSERVKIYRQYSQIEHQAIIQEFTRMRRTKTYLLSKTVNSNHRLERIETSQIPKIIEEFYLNANGKHDVDATSDVEVDDESVQSSTPADPCSSTYNPCVWDTLQAILSHVVDGHPYEFSSPVAIENDPVTRLTPDTAVNVLDTIDTLLHALNEPSYSCAQRKISTDNLAALVTAADACLTDEPSPSKPIPISPSNALSLLIDLAQFRLSHAALIHLRSRHVIYIRKHVVWFGASASNDICLKKFNEEQTCQYVTDRHACLFYDRKRNLFELLNYSEYGTIVNGLRYGLGNLSDDESDIDDEPSMENEKLHKCFCLSTPAYHSAWDGPAQLEQGTVVRIGCHEFNFYRHVVR